MEPELTSQEDLDKMQYKKMARHQKKAAIKILRRPLWLPSEVAGTAMGWIIDTEPGFIGR